MVRQRAINPADFREPVEKLLNPEEPHSDLVPIGNTGIYVNPDKPVEPWDCERWDGSLFCGGNPWGGFVPKIDISPVFDECNIGIQAQPQGFGIKFPEFQVVYRRAECRGIQPQELPPPTPNTRIENFPKLLGSTMCTLFLGSKQTQRALSGTLVNYPIGGTTTEKRFLSSQKAGSLWNFTIQGSWDGYIDFYKDPTVLRSFSYGVGSIFGFGSQTLYFYYGGMNFVTIEGKNQWILWLGSSSWKSSTGWNGEDTSTTLGGACVVRGRYDVILNYLNGYIKFYEQTIVRQQTFSGSKAPTPLTIYCDFAYPENPKPIKDPPPPPRRKCCTMGCCPPKNSDNNDRLLRLILQKVTKLEKITGDPISPVKTVFDGFDRIIKFLGIKEMPAKFPKRLIYPKGKGQVELNNLLEILGYQVKQLDRAIGHLPQTIKVTDTNPAESGNQSVEVEVHSLADFNREILKYLIDTEGDVDATNNMLVRCLYELGFIHQGVVQADAMLDALVEWADFKQVYKKIKVPFAFDPYAGQKGKVGQGFDKQKNTGGKGATTEEEVEDLLPKLLQNKEVEIRILVNGESKSVNDLLQDIKRDTAAAAAGVSEKSSPERLEQLVAASQLVLKLQGAIDRNNSRTALTAGFLKTKPKKET